MPLQSSVCLNYPLACSLWCSLASYINSCVQQKMCSRFGAQYEEWNKQSWTVCCAMYVSKVCITFGLTDSRYLQAPLVVCLCGILCLGSAVQFSKQKAHGPARFNQSYSIWAFGVATSRISIVSWVVSDQHKMSHMSGRGSTEEVLPMFSCVLCLV
jgi:hypothetical protein